MRDLLVVMPGEGTPHTWCLDFDIVDGYPKFVPFERNTQDQRAAIAAYTFKGTIPGKPDIGINWSSLYNNSDDTTLVTVDNEVKQAIQEYAAIPEGPNGMYTPIYESKEGGGISIAIYQG